MKKFFTVLLSLCFFVTCNLTGQNFYFSPEGRTEMAVSTSKLIIQFQPGITFEQQQLILAGENQIVPLQPEMLLPAPRLTLVDLQNVTKDQEIYTLISQLEMLPQVVYAGHFLEHSDGTLHGVTNKVLVRLNSPADKRQLDLSVEDFGARVESINEFDPLLYHISVQPNAKGNALQFANELASTGLFAYAEPDFLRLMQRFNTNDPLLGTQWSLENTGSNTSQYGGIAGIDMSVFAAWGTTTGSNSIKVAIIDEGVDLDHPDLIGNMVGGYDATGQGSAGDMQGDDAHGTACAGIVAASGNNSLGVAGVAYNVKIVPIRIAYSNSGGGWVTSNSWIANGMNWAWQTGGADVLSNSWGGGGSSSAINGAISGSITSGRGGLGAPVLFSAGNGNGSVKYPANNNNTIAVIAMSMCGERKNPSSCDGESWWGSDYGTNGDVAAPGVKIQTTDIAGGNGYSGGDYVASFNGTSSACPNAAGVMALILSANSALTETQARAILEGNCDKVGGYTYNSSVAGQPNGTWSNELGYGLVNAYAAVQAAAPSASDDAGISYINSPNGLLCATSASPQVVLNNYGANTLTSVTINYNLDGGANSTYNWTGSIPSTSSTTLTLPTIGFTDGSHTYTVSTSNPNGNTDTNPANDDATSSFFAGDIELTLSILLDNYPGETTWELANGSGGILASGGPYAGAGTTVTEALCVPEGCYDFTIYDSYGDGICCAWGVGNYSLTVNTTGEVLASGGEFASSETTNVCVSKDPEPTCDDGIQNGDETGIDCGGISCPPCVSCSDGIQNGDETGVDCGGSFCDPCVSCADGIQNGDETGIDCGGSSCPPCVSCSDGIQNGDETGVDCGGSFCPPCNTTCSYVDIDFEDFEGGWGIWNDGGKHCRRKNKDANYAYSGIYCVRLRDNTHKSVMTTDALDLTTFDEITVDFTYYARSMDNANEDFWLQLSTDGGTTFTTVEEWNRGDEFNNNIREFDSVVIPGPFTVDTKLRFRCDASGKNDWVYIDDVDITGCTTGPSGGTLVVESPKPEVEQPLVIRSLETPEQIETGTVAFKLFPNPANELLNVSIQLPQQGSAQLFLTDYAGKLLRTIPVGEGQQDYQTELETYRLSPGIYFLHLITTDEKVTKKLVVVH